MRTAPPARAPGEYIVTAAPAADGASISSLYADYGVREIVHLGGNTFLLKLRHDPGLEAMQRKGTESGQVKAVQPNFIYRAL